MSWLSLHPDVRRLPLTPTNFSQWSCSIAVSGVYRHLFFLRNEALLMLLAITPTKPIMQKNFVKKQRKTLPNNCALS